MEYLDLVSERRACRDQKVADSRSEPDLSRNLVLIVFELALRAAQARLVSRYDLARTLVKVARHSGLEPFVIRREVGHAHRSFVSSGPCRQRFHALIEL